MCGKQCSHKREDRAKMARSAELAQKACGGISIPMMALGKLSNESLRLCRENASMPDQEIVDKLKAYAIETLGATKTV